MGILTLFTILLVVMRLGGSHLQEAKVCPFYFEQIAIAARNKNNLADYLSIWAVKLVTKDFYLLNITTSPNTQKRVQTNFIYTGIHTFEG